MEISLRCIYALGGVSVVRKLGGEVLVDVVWGLGGGGGRGIFFIFFIFYLFLGWRGGRCCCIMECGGSRWAVDSCGSMGSFEAEQSRTAASSQQQI